jgi:hypothetical protein
MIIRYINNGKKIKICFINQPSHDMFKINTTVRLGLSVQSDVFAVLQE